MFSLSLPINCKPFISRTNVTLQLASEIPPAISASILTDAAPTPEKGEATVLQGTSSPQSTSKLGRQRRRKIPTRRANISLENPRTWNRPIGVDVLPAYDEALKYITEDSNAIKLEMAEISKRMKSIEGSEDNEDKLKVKQMQEKLGILEIQSEINIPSVRWSFANAMGDYSRFNIKLKTHED